MVDRVASGLSRIASRARMLWITAGAVLAGVKYMAVGRDEPSIVLHPGDNAPDFTLAGSDGQTYRLADFRGRRAVVLAWFPKAFTGG